MFVFVFVIVECDIVVLLVFVIVECDIVVYSLLCICLDDNDQHYSFLFCRYRKRLHHIKLCSRNIIIIAYEAIITITFIDISL